MPLYEFHCDECDAEFEELLSGVHEADEVSCPGCGNEKVERLLSGFALRGAARGGSFATTSNGCSPSGGFS